MKRFAPGGTSSVRGLRSRSASGAFMTDHFSLAMAFRRGFRAYQWRTALTLSGGRPEVVVTDRLRSTTILTRNAIFAAAKSSNSIARSPLPNGVKLPLETTGGSNILARPRSSDSAQQSRAHRLGRHDPGRGLPSASSQNRGNRMTV